MSNPAIDMDGRIERFLAGSRFAVVGASSDRAKYGNKVLRAYQQAGRAVTPVNPAGGVIEGVEAVADLASLPQPVDGVSIITQPAVTERVVEEAARLGIRRVWMQPGAESVRAVRRAEELGLEPISGGPCVLVALRFRE